MKPQALLANALLFCGALVSPAAFSASQVPGGIARETSVSQTSTRTLRRPKILVLVDREAQSQPRFDLDLSQRVVGDLRRALGRAGYQVVDAGQVNAIRERKANLFDTYVTENTSKFERFLAAETHADTWVRVGVQKDKQKLQQGRFRVTNDVSVIVADAYENVAQLDEQLRGQGSSIESYRDSHEQSLRSLIGGVSKSESLVGMIDGKLKERAKEESVNGRMFLVNTLSNFKGLSRLLVTRSELSFVSGVVQVESLTSAPESKSFAVHYKGAIGDLEDAILQLVLTKRAAMKKELDGFVEVETALSRRTIDVMLDMGTAPSPSLDDELRRGLLKISKSLYQKNPEWYADVPVKFFSASIPAASTSRKAVDTFARGYWSEYDRIAQLTEESEVDPLNYEGTVQIEGVNYSSLRDARSEQQNMFSEYLASEAGRLASSLASEAGDAFSVATNDGMHVIISDELQSEVLTVIKSEAELFREEGAVTPDSIAFFEREGTQRGVFTKISRVLERYKVTLTVVDMNGGPKQTGSFYLDETLTPDLDRILGA